MGKTQTASGRFPQVIENVVQLPLKELVPFPDHPFSVRDDDAMRDTAESVRQSGILMPLIVRPSAEGYQIVSGHRRKHAAELLGLETVPAIVRLLDDDEAIIFMVDSNIQRENILPSEKATPSLSQAQRMRQMSKLGKLNEDTMLKVMSEQKKPEGMNITLPWKKISKYFPSSYTPREIEDVIFRLLAQWQRRRQQNQER